MLINLGVAIHRIAPIGRWLGNTAVVTTSHVQVVLRPFCAKGVQHTLVRSVRARSRSNVCLTKRTADNRCTLGSGNRWKIRLYVCTGSKRPQAGVYHARRLPRYRDVELRRVALQMPVFS